jgi:outer membrane protein TolC
LEAQRLIRDTVLPKSQANVDVALRSIQAGTIDSLKYLEVERTMRSLLIEAIHADQEIWTVVIDLERAMGVPLVRFHAEEADDYPRVPQQGSHNNDMETQE